MWVLPPESSDNDHGDDTWEEEDNHDRVDDGEPVDLYVCHGQVNVPSGGPLDVRWFPHHRIGVVKPRNIAKHVYLAGFVIG